MRRFPELSSQCASGQDARSSHCLAAPSRRRTRCKALLVYPRFAAHSFWNYQATCELVGAKYCAAPLGLATVAALLPPRWDARIVDCNVQELEAVDLEWADVVMTGGMMSQRRDALKAIRMAHARGKPVVVGGPDATCSPEVYAEAEFRVLGEAEDVMSEFLSAWASGAERGVFTARSFPDLSRSPVPRFDLLRLEQYMHVGVQFSRGCPFQCEFCNVIELNGRVPRTKQPEQILRELDALYALGYRGHVDFVDDNLIGNRKAAQSLLRTLRSWLDMRGRPFEFSTEASINLADDEEMLESMREANFFAVFVGIETPNADALLQAHKKQNTRRDIVGSIRRIHRSGIFVNAGFIIGFDAEKESVAASMVECIEAANIPVCMVGLLYALPGTQLSRRLQAEGRLDPDACSVSEDDADQCTSGLNFTPCRPKREALRDYREVLERVYAPERFFGRVRRLGRELDRSRHRSGISLHNSVRDVRSFMRMAWEMGVRDRQVRHYYWTSLLDCLVHNPRALKIVASCAALYLHLGPFSRWIVDRLDRRIAESKSRKGPAGAPSEAHCDRSNLHGR